MNYYAEGRKKEIEFAKLMFNDVYRLSTKKEDIEKHWDILDLNTNLKYDVKSLKKINRVDNYYTQYWHVIELKNVNGKNGWLFGEADFFAFEIINYWIIVKKEKLKNFVKKIMIKEKVNEKMPYYLTSREKYGRKDLFLYVNTLDLCFLAEKIMQKKEFTHIKNFEM